MKKKSWLLLGILVFILSVITIYFVSPVNLGKLLSELLGSIGKLAVKTIEFLGYPGLTILMALESMIIPLPSELVMPFAGFLAVEGQMNLGLVIFFSALGSIIGSLISYYLGYYGGNKFVLKLGKYLLLDVTDLEKTENWFQKRGTKTIFFSRFIPVVRHLISIPAGIGKMDLKKFCLYTIIGAAMWNSFLAYLGYILGKNWNMVRNYSEYFSLSAAIIIFIAGILFIHHHIKNKTQEKNALQRIGK